MHVPGDDEGDNARAGERLKELEEAFFMALERSNDAVAITQQNMRHVYVNQKLVEMFGYDSAEEVLNEQALSMIHPDDRQAIVGDGEARIKGEAVPDRNQFRGLKKNGDTIYIEASVIKIIFHGEIAILVYLRDRGAEEALKRSEARYRRLFDSALSAIFILKDGRCVDCNRASLTMFRCDREFLLGRALYEFSPPVQSDGLESKSQALWRMSRAESGEAQVFEWTHVRGDGTPFDVEVTLLPVHFGEEMFTQALVRDITDFNFMRRCLEASEEKYRSLVTRIPVSVWTADQAGNVTFVTPNLQRILGYEPEEICDPKAEAWWRQIHPEDTLAVRGAYERHFLHHVPFDAEYRVLRKNGECRWVYDRAEAPYEKDGFWYTDRVLEDITERKNTEKQLRIAYKKLWDILEFLPDPAFVIDGARRVTAWNNAMERVTGVKKDDMLGKGDRAYAVPFYGVKRPMAIDLALDPDEGVEDTYRRLRREGNLIMAENYVPMPVVGKPIYLSATASPLLDDKGNIIGAIESIRDITEQKRVEEALLESEECYRTTIESSNDGIAITKDGKYLYVNRSFVETFGFDTPREVVGQSIDINVHPDDRELVIQRNAKRLRNENAPKRYEFKGIKKDGRVMFIEVSAGTTTLQGELVGFAYFRDLTERRNLEAQLLQAQKMEAVGTLAGGIAHDFNNMLMALMGYANILQMKLDRSDPLRVYVDPIVGCIGRAANLTRSLLVFGRKQVMELRPCNLNALLSDMQKLLRRLLPEDIDLTFELGPEMTIMVDPTQIDQVLINLSTNARDAMPKGGKLRIDVQEAVLDDEYKRVHGFGEPGKYAVISVRDNGIGMDEATKTKIFEPFFTTKEVGKGTGLGLSIVYGIVKQHDGYIDVDSRLNYGTVFHIYLPLIAAKPSETEVAPSLAQGGDETILLAEDDPDVRSVAREILRMAGYKIIEAVDGEDAVKRFLEHKDKVAILILDVVMPNMNGKEAWEEIRRLDQSVKVLFMSGYTGDIVLDKGVHDQGFEYISKPLDTNQLLAKIRKILDG